MLDVDAILVWESRSSPWTGSADSLAVDPAKFRRKVRTVPNLEMNVDQIVKDSDLDELAPAGSVPSPPPNSDITSDLTATLATLSNASEGWFKGGPGER